MYGLPAGTEESGHCHKVAISGGAPVFANMKPNNLMQSERFGLVT